MSKPLDPFDLTRLMFETGAAMFDVWEIWWRGHPGRRVELRLVSEDGHEPLVEISVVRWI